MSCAVCGATKETRKKERKKNKPKLENIDLSLVVAVECACPSLLQLQNILTLQVGHPTAPFQTVANLASWISQQLRPELCLHLFPLLE